MRGYLGLFYLGLNLYCNVRIEHSTLITDVENTCGYFTEIYTELSAALNFSSTHGRASVIPKYGQAPYSHYHYQAHLWLLNRVLQSITIIINIKHFNY